MKQFSSDIQKQKFINENSDETYIESTVYETKLGLGDCWYLIKQLTNRDLELDQITSTMCQEITDYQHYMTYIIDPRKREIDGDIDLSFFDSNKRRFARLHQLKSCELYWDATLQLIEDFLDDDNQKITVDIDYLQSTNKNLQKIVYDDDFISDSEYWFYEPKELHPVLTFMLQDEKYKKCVEHIKFGPLENNQFTLQKV